MRIALYGTDEEKLEGHKQRLHNPNMDIYSFINSKDIREYLK